MGQKVSLTETASGAGLPYLYDDTIMGAGSLILHDLGHSLGGVTGIPANAATIPNVAWATANSVVAGAPGQAALSSVVTSDDVLALGATASASFPFTERTPKGGLHIVKSQANDVSGKRYLFAGAASILAYLTANPDHAYYYSVWHYVTRGATTAGSPFPGVMNACQNTGNGILALQPNAVVANTMGVGTNMGKASSGAGAAILNVTGAAMHQWAVSAHTGSTASWSLNPFMFGGAGGPFNSLHVGPSNIFYRCYLEDLTVSAAAGGYANAGAITAAARYAEVAARDLALYNTAIGAGGKFNGDSFTAPAGYP